MNEISRKLTCCEVDDDSLRSEPPLIVVEVVRHQDRGIVSARAQIRFFEPGIVSSDFGGDSPPRKL